MKEGLCATGVDDRPVEELSGGQRQRVWLALLLAQQTPVLLLAEPTAYLDIVQQIEVVDLCRRLQTRSGRTLVAVLNDLTTPAATPPIWWRSATGGSSPRKGGEGCTASTAGWSRTR